MNHTQYFNFPLFEETDKPSWLTDWNGLVTALDNDLETLRSSILANSGEITAIGTSISRINNDIDELKIVTDTLTTSTENLMGSVNIIQNTLLQIDSEVKSLSTRITDLDSSVGARLTELENSVEDIITNISSFRNEFETFLNAIVKEYNSGDYYQKYDFVYIVRDGVKSYYMATSDNPNTQPPSGDWASSFKVADIASYARRLAETNRLKLNDVRSAMVDTLSSLFAKWQPSREYAVGNIVFVENNDKYDNLTLPIVAECTTAHTSGAIFDDTNWTVFDITNATTNPDMSKIGSMAKSLRQIELWKTFAEDTIREFKAGKNYTFIEKSGITTSKTSQSFVINYNSVGSYIASVSETNLVCVTAFVEGNATTDFVPRRIGALIYHDATATKPETYVGTKRFFISGMEYIASDNTTAVELTFEGTPFNNISFTQPLKMILLDTLDINGHSFVTNKNSNMELYFETTTDVEV